MASQSVISVKRARLAEDKELLAQVKEAISAILTGAQSYTIGSRSLSRADLGALLEWRDELYARVIEEEAELAAAESGSGGRRKSVGVVLRDW